MHKFQVYIKPVSNAFAGKGQEYLIVANDIIRVHGRTWDNSDVVDVFDNALQGQHINMRGKGWRKMIGAALEDAQAWAEGVVWYAEVTQ